MWRRVLVACAKHDRDRWRAVSPLNTDAGEWQPSLFFLRTQFTKYLQPRRSHLIAPGELVEIIYPNTAIDVSYHDQSPPFERSNLSRKMMGKDRADELPSFWP